MLGGGVGGALTGAWGVYSTITTAKDLPADAGWIAKMIADPPVYAPWLLFAFCAVFLAWVLWFRPDQESDGDTTTTTTETRGPGSPAFGSVSGNVNIYNGDAPKEPAPEPAKSPWDDPSFSLTAPQLPAPPPRADMPLKDVAFRIMDALGINPDSGTNVMEGLRKIDLALADAIVHEKLTVWARFASFPIKVLGHHDLRHVIVETRRNVIKIPNDWHVNEYTDVGFVKAEIDRAWPPKEDSHDKQD